MAKYIVTYCPECQRNTTHKIYVEDGYGVSGISRIFSNLVYVILAILLIVHA